MIRKICYFFTFIVFLTTVRDLGAIGRLYGRIPNWENSPVYNLRIKSFDVQVTIQDQLAVTHIDEVFANDTNWRLEGIYILKLPEGAKLTEMYLFRRWTPIILLICLGLGCSDDNNPINPKGEEFIYPLRIGNQWHYDRTFSLFNFRPDTLGFPYSDTYFFRFNDKRYSQPDFAGWQGSICFAGIPERGRPGAHRKRSILPK